MSKTKKEKTRFSSRDLFNQLAGREFNNYKQLEEAILPIFNAHLEDFPPDYSYRDAVTKAEKSGWLVSHPEHGLIVSMHVWKSTLKPKVSVNRVDVLQGIIDEFQEHCEHRFQAESEIRLLETRVKNVWIELNAQQRMVEGKMFPVTPISWKCEDCSKKRSGDYCLYCPFCQHRLSYGGVILEQYEDFERYIENWKFVQQDKLFVFNCHGCGAGFIRPEK